MNESIKRRMSVRMNEYKYIKNNSSENKNKKSIEHRENMILSNYYYTLKLLRENEFAYVHNLGILLENISFLEDNMDLSKKENLDLIEDIKKTLLKSKDDFINNIEDKINTHFLNLNKNSNTDISKIYNQALESIDSFCKFCEINIHYLDLILEDIWENYDNYNIDIIEFLFKLRSCKIEIIEKNSKFLEILENIVRQLLFNTEEDFNLKENFIEEAFLFMYTYPFLFKYREAWLKTFLSINEKQINTNSWAELLSCAKELLKLSINKKSKINKGIH